MSAIFTCSLITKPTHAVTESVTRSFPPKIAIPSVPADGPTLPSPPKYRCGEGPIQTPKYNNQGEGAMRQKPLDSSMNPNSSLPLEPSPPKYRHGEEPKGLGPHNPSMDESATVPLKPSPPHYNQTRPPIPLLVLSSRAKRLRPMSLEKETPAKRLPMKAFKCLSNDVSPSDPTASSDVRRSQPTLHQVAYNPKSSNSQD